MKVDFNILSNKMKHKNEKKNNDSNIQDELKDQNQIKEEINNIDNYENKATPEVEKIEEKTLTVEEQQQIKIRELESKTDELNDKYLRICSEFDNFKKRNAKERIELFKTANEDIVSSLLTVLDDFERANKSLNETSDIQSVTEGVNLIYNKFKNILNQKGLQEVELSDNTFNTDFHEAITNIPASDETQKGKIIDTIEKGYMLNGKVIRYAKVVVAT